MLPWKSIIQIQTNSDLPVYLQIANSIIKAIKNGVIQPGGKLPSTRSMSALLQVHRKTVVCAFEELDALSIKALGVSLKDLPFINP